MEAQAQASGIAPRRQALNACDSCRQRKTKCDELKPSCGRCTRLGLECSYVETVLSKKNLSVSELNDTLKRMDGRLEALTHLVESQGQSLKSLQHSRDHISHAFSNPSPSVHPTLGPFTPSFPFEMASPHSSSVPYLDTGRIRDELSLTQKHSTAPQHLLTWPCSPISMSEKELQYPTQLEINRPKMSRTSRSAHESPQSPREGSSLSQLPMSQLSQLTQCYFSHFHPSCLILDEGHFYGFHLNHAMRSNFAESLDTCLVVLVCALGTIASRFLDGNERSGESEEHTGYYFFTMAQEMLLHVEGPDWVSVQCLLLSGIFFSSKLRVYDAWRFIHRACSTILILVPLQDQLEAHQAQLFWIAYLQESQLLAEFDFPPSGLGKLAGSVALPLVPDAGTDPHHAKYQFFFLALISMRKLLNRVLYHVYKQEQRYDEAHPTTSSPREERFKVFFSANKLIIEELDRQLEEWRTCLPPGLMFPPYSPSQEPPLTTEPHEPRPIDDRLRGHLLARYYVAKSILHRPFLYRVLHFEQDPGLLSDNDRIGAVLAVHSAFLSTIYSGLFHEPLPMLLHPINSWRSMFALELQVAFCRLQDPHHFALPRNYEIIRQIRQRLADSPVHSCPSLKRDEEVLRLLE